MQSCKYFPAVAILFPEQSAYTSGMKVVPELAGRHVQSGSECVQFKCLPVKKQEFMKFYRKTYCE
jgi:hypothetical protein